MSDDFAKTISGAYASTGPAVQLGRGVHDGKLFQDAVVQVPLKMMNRHGLIAGATGTGKTKTLQGLAEQLSAAGVPVFLADLKGDLSGLAAPGESDPRVLERVKAIGAPFTPAASPVEFLSLTGTRGIPVRATISSFG